jgi:hypothetical protein
MYLVVDNEFNRANNANIIGQLFDSPPSYTAVQYVYKGTLCPKCGCDNHLILNSSMPTVNECINCRHRWNPDNDRFTPVAPTRHAESIYKIADRLK